MKYFGGIEAGGTKFICAVSDGEMNIIDRISISTREPEETLADVFDFFSKYEILAVGLSSFGPIDINKKSETYGYILSTPKLAWRNFPFLKTIEDTMNIPVYFTTDVNAAAFGEYKMGSSVNTESSIYVTIGTGIGAGIILDGEIFDGIGHPEVGHMRVTKVNEDEFEGSCFYHGDCLEGLANGPSIKQRTGIKGQDLEKENKVWIYESKYLAQMCMNLTLTIRPERIVLGGGVMKQEHLVGMVRDEFITYLNDYVHTPPVSEYIVTPKLGDNAGIIGSLLLAKNVYEERK